MEQIFILQLLQEYIMLLKKHVTKEMRYKAKSVNFGIIYGQGAFGLADNLGISRTEAKEIIDNYKKAISGYSEIHG